MAEYFPDAMGKNLLIDEDAKTYISRPDDARKIASIILDTVKSSSITITDATANVGGDTISFAKVFRSVNSVEITSKYAKMLKHNIQQYNLDNVTVYNSDYLDIMATLKQDVIYMDPPWTGSGYLKSFTIDLALSKTDIMDVIETIRKDKLSAYTFIKVPYNFNFKRLFELYDHTIINLHRIRKIYLITIKNY